VVSPAGVNWYLVEASPAQVGERGRGVAVKAWDDDPDDAQPGGADALVVLYVGRLAFHAKAHPDAMHVGLEMAARRSGKTLVLVQAGWFASDAVREAYEAGAAAAAPSVRTLFVDGQDADVRRRGWAAADMFISLSDNVQETFGLTPVEAIRIMTLNGATILGVAKDVGSIEPGKYADLAVINGDPMTDPHALRKTVLVFKEGVGYDAARLHADVKGLVGLR
jgi:N-acyl-D-aspartate/D-glutamate deacylase